MACSDPAANLRLREQAACRFSTLRHPCGQQADYCNPSGTDFRFCLQVIVAHRHHIDDIMELMKLEMKEISDVDQPGSSIDTYVRNLDALLLKKMQKIQELRTKVLQFQEHLREEEVLSVSMMRSSP